MDSGHGKLGPPVETGPAEVDPVVETGKIGSVVTSVVGIPTEFVVTTVTTVLEVGVGIVYSENVDVRTVEPIESVVMKEISVPGYESTYDKLEVVISDPKLFVVV